MIADLDMVGYSIVDNDGVATQLSRGLQLYVDEKSKTAYLFLNDPVSRINMKDTSHNLSASLRQHQADHFLNLLFLFLVSRVVIVSHKQGTVPMTKLLFLCSPLFHPARCQPTWCLTWLPWLK